MAEKRMANSSVTVKTHHSLPKVTENDIRMRAAEVLSNADQGIQTALVAEDGQRVRSVIGLNGFRYLPDPDPDPLDEAVSAALDSARDMTKSPGSRSETKVRGVRK